MSIKSILVLTGAGISAESGIPTFRGSDGLWEGHRPEEVASPIAFQRDPGLVHRFYNQRRSKLLSSGIEPNLAHRALADFERRFTGEFLLVTQNVDDLHQRAGSQNIIAMHGEIMKARCLDTGEVFPWKKDLSLATPHPKYAERSGRLRPHIVWFGEMPLEMERIQTAANEADLFVAIGTSAVVYPAAALVEWTKSKCRTVEINTENTPQSNKFDQALRGKATEQVPRLFNSLLSEASDEALP